MKLGWALMCAVCGVVPLGCCKKPPKPGDVCTAGKAACLDKSTELVCQDSVFVTTACKGPKGCHESEARVFCDISANPDGEPCPKASDDNAACSPDKKQMVICHAGKYRVHNCRGPKGCDDAGDQVECDKTLQKEGDPCATEDSYTCSVDKKRSLVCKGGKFVLDEQCRGPGGCDSTADKVRCDRGAQNVGDPCHKQGDFECSVDGKTMLGCKAGHWAADKKCKHKCVSTDDKVGCSD
jgi:hypothetical protein